MDTKEIIRVIKRRRDKFFEDQALGTAHDPLTHTAADAFRVVADEYDSLLKEIKAG